MKTISQSTYNSIYNKYLKLVNYYDELLWNDGYDDDGETTEDWSYIISMTNEFNERYHLMMRGVKVN